MREPFALSDSPGTASRPKAETCAPNVTLRAVMKSRCGHTASSAEDSGWRSPNTPGGRPRSALRATSSSLIASQNSLLSFFLPAWCRRRPW